MVCIGFLLLRLSFNLQSHSILPHRGSGNIFESAGQKIYDDFGPVVMAWLKFQWLHFLGLSNNRMLYAVFSRDQ